MDRSQARDSGRTKKGFYPELQVVPDADHSAYDTLQTLLQFSPVGIMLLDREENVRLWNPAMEAIFGWKEEEVLGRPWPAVPEDRQAESDAFRRRGLAGEELLGVRMHRLRKDGSSVEVLHNSAPTRDSSGTVSGFVLLMRDVTEEERTEKRLHFQTGALDQINDAVIGTDLVGRITYWNPAAGRLTGVAAEEALGRLPQEILPLSLLAEQDVEGLNRIFSEPGYDGGEISVTSRDSRELILEVSQTLVRDSSGAPQGGIAVVRDVTQRRRDQDVLRESEETLRAVVATAPLAIVEVDTEDKVTLLNPAAERLFGWSEAEVLGKPLPYVPEDKWAEAEAHRQSSLRGETCAGVELVRQHKDGSPIDLKLWSAPLIADGRVRGLIGVFVDLTQQKEAERARVAAAQERGAILEGLGDVILQYVTPDLRVVWANKGARKFMAGSDQEVIGRHCYDVTYGLKHPCPQCLALQAVQSGVSQRGEVRNPRGQIMIARYEPVRDEAGQVTGVVVFALDVSEQRDTARELQEKRAELVESIAELRTTQTGIVQALGAVTEARDPYTAGHQRRVSELACAIGERMGMAAERVEALKVAGLVHDMGKIAVPVEILVYPGPLGATERLLIERHATASYEILKSIHFSWPVAQIAHQHHERLDGSGYPQGLIGDRILLEARILAVADTVEAMTSHRPYRPALSLDLALAEIDAGQDRLFDREVVQACLAVIAAGDWTPGQAQPIPAAVSSLVASEISAVCPDPQAELEDSPH